MMFRPKSDFASDWSFGETVESGRGQTEKCPQKGGDLLFAEQQGHCMPPPPAATPPAAS